MSETNCNERKLNLGGSIRIRRIILSQGGHLPNAEKTTKNHKKNFVKKNRESFDIRQILGGNIKDNWVKPRDEEYGRIILLFDEISFIN
uniref:Uncharacterized protein n=1 Tax=Romanomermis culicivorax TaxID=13658 RepID=A0A915IFR8_ROMCU